MTKSNKPRTLPHKNRDHTGWWIASFIQRFEYFDEDKKNLNRRCVAWENTILIRAHHRDEAYKKAVAFGRRSHGNRMWSGTRPRRGAWRFEGLTSLLPVYEEIEDGAEILWKEHAGVSVRKVKERIRKRLHLEAFDDRPR